MLPLPLPLIFEDIIVFETATAINADAVSLSRMAQW